MFTAKISGGRASYAYEKMTDAIKEIDSEVSLTRPDSDLCKFNAAEKDQKVEVGEHCYNLFMLSVEYGKLTDGAFNAAALPLSELWGVSVGSGFSGDFVLPDPKSVEDALTYCDTSCVSASEEDGKYYMTKSDGRVRLDFGGIAKGYAADVCARLLDGYEISSALLDISGNTYFYGKYIERGAEADWNVGIMSPRPRAGEALTERGYVAAITLGGDCSAVTSGDYMRYYVHDYGDGTKVYIPHIIGADGVPLGVTFDGSKWVNKSEWVISATVVGERSALCDALSTAVAASGIDDGVRLLQKAGCKGLIFCEKRYTIIGNVKLYKPDVYDGFSAYEYYEL